MASQGATTFNALVQHLPTPLQSAVDAAALTLSNAYLQLPEPARAYIHDAAEKTQLNTPVGLAGTTLLILTTAVAMSRWSPAYWGQRLGGNPFDRSTPVVVRENDNPSNDLEELRRSDPQSSHGVPIPNDLEDDSIRLKNKGKEYKLVFPAFSIGDGKLYVKDLRDRAALALGVKNRPIKLLYKGRQLKDDDRLCRDYNLKDKSEVLCIVGEQAEDSGEETEDGTINSKDSKKKRKRKSKSGKKKKDKGSKEDLPYRTDSPASNAPKSPIERLQAIASNFHTALVPECVKYITGPPEDPKKKDFEHKKLSETIMQHVLLKLDGVETEGDQNARQFRKDLVKETQMMLNKLDVAAGVPLSQ